MDQIFAVIQLFKKVIMSAILDLHILRMNLVTAPVPMDHMLGIYLIMNAHGDHPVEFVELVKPRLKPNMIKAAYLPPVQIITPAPDMF